MNEVGSQRRACYRLLLITLWATLLVFVIEATAGWVAKSMCLLAESLHTLIDVFSTLLSLTAVASPQRPLGRDIWGHGRSEVVGALSLCAFLGFAGMNLFIMAIRQFESSLHSQAIPFPVEVTMPLVQLISAMVAITLTLALGSAYQGRYFTSLAFKANTTHVLQDSWLSILVLLGLVGIWRGYRWLDPLFAIVLLLLLANSLWRVLDAQLPSLLRPTAIAPEAIAHIACQVEGVTHCTRILSRGMVGRHVWIELHLALHPEFMSLSRTIGERVENALRLHYGPVRTQIWVEQTYSAAIPSQTGYFKHQDL
jgi:cation diffusion facilitator family transporter